MTMTMIPTSPLSLPDSSCLAFVSMPGGGEWMIIFIVALLLFGSKKLPELARGIGKAMSEFRSAQREFQDEIRRAEYAVREETRKLPLGTGTSSGASLDASTHPRKDV
jgi:TatA/E family protein of Tat protein translocase